MSHCIADTLKDVHLGPRQAYKALTLWPLLRSSRADHGAPGAPAEQTGPLDYLALADALECGFVDVEERDAYGEVQSIRVGNRSSQSVLVLFGEELRGAKQNRVANATFLVPAGCQVSIDVSCVEAGRWGRRLGFLIGQQLAFESSADVLSLGMRRKMARKVAGSRARHERFDADQTEVWREVERRLTGSGASSSTSAYADYLGAHEGQLSEMANAFHTLDGQVGFVAALGDEVVGAELVGRPDVFARVFQKLLRSYAIDAIDAMASYRARVDHALRGLVRFDAPEPFLRAVAEAPVRRTGPSIGLGEDLRLEKGAVEGCALEVRGELVHLTVFPGGEEMNEQDQ